MLALLLCITWIAGCEIGGRRDGTRSGEEGEGEGSAEGEGEGSAEGEGEGEGPAEGEGEGPAEGEGEGEGPAEGEGEGPAEGEGEGPAEGEGEGPAEGEGEGGTEGEGEGEGADAGGPAVDAGPRPPSLTGVINVTQIFADPLGAYRGNGGVFFDESGEPPQVEGCQIVPSEEADGQPSYHAGIVRVSGGGRELVLTPEPTDDGMWLYRSNLAESNASLFDEGDRLVFTGDGGAHVGAFGVEIVAPDRVTVTSPAIFPQPREGAAVSVRWNADDTAGVLITIASKRGGLAGQPVPGNTILCGGPDDGSETVPADLMARLPDGDGFILGVARIKIAEAAVDANTSVVATAIMAAGLALTYQ